MRALVPIADAVYGGLINGTGLAAATSLELTTAWNVNAAYEHFWSPRWRTSLYGGYAQVSYGGAAQSLGCGFGTGGAVTNGCDMATGALGGSVRALSGTSPRTSTWVWT